MERLVIQKGKKGLIGGFADSGKVILVDRKYLSSVKEDEVYWCNMIEKDRFYIATNLKKEISCEAVVWDDKVFVNNKQIPVVSKEIFYRFGRYISKYTKYTLDKSTIPEYIKVENLRGNIVSINENIADTINYDTKQFKEVVEKLIGINKLDQDSLKSYQNTLSTLERIETQKVKREHNRQKFYNGGYQMLLDFFNQVKQANKIRQPLWDEYDNIKNRIYQLEETLKETYKKYGTEFYDLMPNREVVFSIEGHDKVILFKPHEKQFIRGYQRWEEKTEYVPESDDGYRPEGYVTHKKWIFYGSPNATWDIPEELLNIPNVLDKICQLEEKSDQAYKKLKAVEIPEIPEHSELDDMFNTAFAEYCRFYDCEGCYDGPWDIEYSQLEEYITKEVIK